MEFAHSPVMLVECVEALALTRGGIYLDGTAGGAGHALEIAQSLKDGRLYAMDQDPDAAAVAEKRLEGLPAEVLCANFREAKAWLAARGVTHLDGALLDLGVSSHQLDNSLRGFSYQANAPLDMRMSQSGPSAAELVNSLTRQALADVFRRYGEEPRAWQMAGKIEEARKSAPIATTGQLAELIISSVPPQVRRKNKNPARRAFQALRIAVNDELGALDEGLNGLFELLKPGGRLVVLTFHSLEDRMVKQRFAGWARSCTCPPELPVCVCGGVARAKLVGKNPRVASPAEQAQNRRSRSAKLRVLEKL